MLANPGQFRVVKLQMSHHLIPVLAGTLSWVSGILS